MSTRETALKKIQAILSKSLDVNEEEIKPESLLFKDFSIESTEILEITFRIEQEFNFTMGESEFWNVASLIANEGMMNDGEFTAEATDLIKEYFEITDEQIKKLGSPFKIYDYITVSDLVNYVFKKTE